MSNIEGFIDIQKEDILTYLNTIFDKPVLLVWPLGVKGFRKKWGNIKYEMTQTAGYQKRLAAAAVAGGNIGVVLGPRSENLIAVDFDSDEEMERFFQYAPWAKNTLISVGSKGCQCWFYIDGYYPNEYKVWKREKGDVVVEFRTNVQSIIWGEHPVTHGRYTNNGKRPLHISYFDLQEYHSHLVEQAGGTDEDVWRPGQKGDYNWTKRYKGCDLHELDLLGMVKEAGVSIYEQLEEGDVDRYTIRCPWIEDHTTENNKRDAMIHVFEPRGKWWPAFTCFHAHCAERGLKDLLEWLEQEYGLGPSVVRKYCGGGGNQRIEVIDCSNLVETSSLPEPIIDGLLYPELKMLISSSAKIGKTWLGIDMALSLASGGLWLGFDTCQTRVFYLNMEMPVPWFLDRICIVRRVKGIEELPKGSFRAANLSGSRIFTRELDPKTVTLNLDPLYDEWKRDPFDVIIYDPLYPLLVAGNLDENKAVDVAKLLGLVSDFARATKVANVLIHHYAKGNPFDKKAGDRASGSGVFLRDPDTFMAITELGVEGSRQAKVDCLLRCSPPVDSFGIRWDNYQWQRDPTIDIASKKKRKKESSEPKAPNTAEKILQILRDSPNGMTYTQWKNAVVVRQITTEGYFEKIVPNLKSKIRKVDNFYFVI